MRLKRTIAPALSFLAAVSLAAALLAACIYGGGTSPCLMEAVMRRNAPSSYTLLPEKEYGGMAGMITGYLTGEVREFQYVFCLQDGGEAICFNETEREHMADCRQLFGLCRTVLIAAAVLASVFAAAAFVLCPDRTAFRGALWGIRAVLIILIVIAVFAVIDFDSVFVLFHKISFSNDLWLMNPSTDMIVRLMPLGFFIEYAALIGGAWLFLLTAAAAILHALSYRRGRKNDL